MLISHIVVVSPGYPTATDPYYPFVQQIVTAFANYGISVTVVAPQSITHALLHNKEIHPIRRKERVRNATIVIVQPFYVSFGTRRRRLNNRSFTMAIKKSLKSIKPYDLVYAHFWQTAKNSYNVIKDSGVPLFVATGESNISQMLDLKANNTSFSKYVSGVIAVSSKNKDESIRLGLTTKDKCRVIPNAIDNKLFYKRDKAKCRRALGLEMDVFIVAFVGWFIDRKGPKRVERALEKCSGVYAFYIGEGPQEPIGNNILFRGRLKHDDLPIYLNAADAFVLPTLNEGCCNAVIEAMACGLPIISSNLPFNQDILNENNSILINPLNIEELASAIMCLHNDRERLGLLSQGALLTAEKLTISNRIEQIMDFFTTSRP